VSHLPKIDAVYVSSINRHRFVLVDIVLYVSAVL